MKSAFGGIPVTNAMLTEFRALDRNQTLEQAVELTISGTQKDFPVTHNNQLVGLLTMENLGEYMRIQAALRN